MASPTPGSLIEAIGYGGRRSGQKHTQTYMGETARKEGNSCSLGMPCVKIRRPAPLCITKVRSASSSVANISGETSRLRQREIRLGRARSASARTQRVLPLRHGAPRRGGRACDHDGDGYASMRRELPPVAFDAPEPLGGIAASASSLGSSASEARRGGVCCPM